MRWATFRNGLQTIHLWVGLAFSIPFILIGLSGSLIVLIDALPALSVPAAPASGAIQPLARIVEAANDSVPEPWSIAGVTVPHAAHEAAGVQLQLPPGRRPPQGFQNLQGRTIYIDPVSLKVLGSSERRRAGPSMRMLTTMHIALMVPNYFGVRLVGWMGIALTLFGLSGLLLWWPRRGQWRNALLLKRGVRGFRFHHDLHSVVGFWSLSVFLIVCISGVYLAFPVTATNMLSNLTQVRTNLSESTVDEATLAKIAGPGPLNADKAVQLALAAVPASVATQVQLPPGEQGLYMITLVPTLYGWDSPQISVFVGPGAEVSEIVDPRTYPLMKRILVWLRVMHYGQGFGVVWEVLVFFSGFLPLLFAVTGFRMWQLKRAQRQSIMLAAVQPAE